MIKKPNLRKMIDASKLYFEKNLNQEEIAKKLGISVPQVSRLINTARNQGYVTTSVVDPFSESDDLTKQLITLFGLKDARIVESITKDKRATQNNVAQAGAEYLSGIVQTNDVISIAYSGTIYKLPKFLPKTHIENVSFVQPNGTLFEHVRGYQYDTLRETSLSMGADYFYFPAPAIVMDQYMKDMLHQDPIIHWILKKANDSNISLFSVEAVDINSLYVKNGYFSSSEMKKISKDGAVGDIFGHFINNQGELLDETLESRVIGMDISKLRLKDYAINISTGEELVNAIHASILGKYCNVLITDTTTAKLLLEKEKQAH